MPRSCVERAPDTAAPWPLRVLSLSCYLFLASRGVLAFTLPGAPASDAAVEAACLAYNLYVAHYLAEAMLALSGRVCLHAWRASEVVRHHLGVALILLPLTILSLCRPDSWPVLMRENPAVVTVSASACLTGINESTFVLRSLLPGDLADLPSVYYAQSLLTLCTLLQNITMTQSACLLGARSLLPRMASLLPRLRGCLASAAETAADGAGGSCPWFAALQGSALLLAYVMAFAFFCLVQAGYVRSNLRRVLKGSPPPRLEATKKAA